MSTTFNNTTAADFVINLEKSGKTLNAHKSILSTNSDFFKTCFESNIKGSISNMMSIDEDDENMFIMMIHSFYRDSIDENIINQGMIMQKSTRHIGQKPQ